MVALCFPHRTNSRLAEANSKLLNERGMSQIPSSIANSSFGGPSLGMGTLGSPVHYGATLGSLNGSLGLSLQNNKVEDYIAKVCKCG